MSSIPFRLPEPLLKYPALIPAIVLIAIILAVSTVYWLAVAICVAGSLAALAAGIVYRRFTTQFFLWPVIFCLALWSVSNAMPPKFPVELSDIPAKYYGEVIDAPAFGSDGPLEVRVEGRIFGARNVPFKHSFNALLFCRQPDRWLRFGDVIQFEASLQQADASSSFNPSENFNPSGQAFLKSRGIVAEGVISTESLKITGRNEGFKSFCRDTRDVLVDKLLNSSLSSSAAYFLATTVFGDSDNLEPDVRERFRSVGLAHTLALSGFHLGIIILLVSFLLRPLTLGDDVAKFRFFPLLLIVWGYVFVTGMMPSVVRAATMASGFLLARLAQRSYSTPNSLAVAVIVILIFDPLALYSSGFQLSFAATASIVFFSRRFVPLGSSHVRLRKLLAAIALPLSAMLGTWVISAYYFHSFPLLFMASNLVACLLLPPLLCGGILLLLFQTVGLDSAWLCSVIDFLYGISNDFSAFLASLPNAEIDGINLGVWSMVFFILATVALGLVFSCNHLKHKILCFASICCLALLGSCGIERLPENEVFFTAQHGKPVIVCRTGDSCLIFSDINPSHLSVRQRHLEWFRSRGLSSTSDSILPFSAKYQNGAITKLPGRIIVGSSEIILHPELAFSPKSKACARYLLLSVPDPDIGSLVNSHIDTVLISPNLSKRESNEIQKRLRSASVPFIDLRSKNKIFKCEN